MNNTYRRILVLAAALIFLSPVLRSEQPPKPARQTQEDRLKKLEDRADADEKATASAAMERDYITRIQKQYESYYQKAFNTLILTVGIVGLLLTGVFVLVARFSQRLIEEQTKTAVAGATVQMRNEYARAIAKEVQKLWDSNAADIKKLKETLTTQFAALDQDLRSQSEFHTHFVQAIAAPFQEPAADSLPAFRNALATYSSCKARNLIEATLGAATIRSIFESLRTTHPDNHLEKAREELAKPIYNNLAEELALAALQSPWLTPLINERNPAPPEPPVPEAPAEVRPVVEPRAAVFTSAAPASAASPPEPPPSESDIAVGEEFDSCRLIST